MAFDGIPPAPPPFQPPAGLTSVEARQRLEIHGPNQIFPKRPGVLASCLFNLWGPVPWLLETSLFLELFFHRSVEVALIGVFLLLNSAIGALQVNKVWKVFTQLQSRLALSAQVLRDHVWQNIPAIELVPGDVIHLQAGDFLPADVEFCEGKITLERVSTQGMYLSQGDQLKNILAYVGDIVRKGEADAVVTATGKDTRSGKEAAFILPSQTYWQSHTPVYTFTRDVAILNIVLAILVLVYTFLTRQPLSDAVPFALILLAVSLPSGLPLMLKMIASQGIAELAQKTVLVPHERALQKTAEMKVLCLDMAGILTEGHLSVARLLPFAPYTEGDVLRLAALASDETTRDPTDIAILEKARLAGALPDLAQRVAYHPFNPSVKRWEAVYETDGQVLRVMKGLPNVLFQLAGSDTGLDREASRLASSGYQVLAVAVGDDTHMQIAGLLALEDPLRADTLPLIHRIHELGVNVIMTTGDELKAAQAVANKIGADDKTYSMQPLRHLVHSPDIDCGAKWNTTYADVMPEDKVKLVEMFQRAHCSIGITGDGSNDMAALRQADVGIVLNRATPAAKATAGLILEKTGLSSIVDAVQTSRQVSHQMLACILTILVMSLVTGLFISLERLLSGTLVMTTSLLVFLLITTSLLKISMIAIQTANSNHPFQITIQSLAWVVLGMAVPSLFLCYAVFWAGKIIFRFSLPTLQTLVFAFLVFSWQGIYYLLLERGHAWKGFTNLKRLISPLIIVTVITLAVSLGIFASPIPLTMVLGLIGLVLLYLLALDFLKIRLFQWLEI
jgi:H+-transporting ATPase